MEATAAQQYAASIDPTALQRLKAQPNDPGVRRAVAAQFASFLTQGLMRNADGSALPMAEGVGGDTVSSLFANVVSQVAASSNQLGLADVLLNSMPGGSAPAASGAKPALAASAGSAPAAAASALGAAAAQPVSGFSLQPYRSGIRAFLGARPLPLSASPLPSRLPPSTATASHSNGAAPAPAASNAAASITTTPGATAASAATLSAPTPSASHATLSADARARFIQRLKPILADAARQLGISPRILMAQAALESGWGTAMPGNNLFGVKAGADWTGATVAAATEEDGASGATRQTDQFRAYPSIEAAVADYTKLVAGGARYGAALGAGDDAAAYGAALTQGGYATDPAYAAKLAAVASSPAMAEALGATATSLYAATTADGGSSV